MTTPDARELRGLVFDFDHTLVDLGGHVDWRAARGEIAERLRLIGLDLARIMRTRRGLLFFDAIHQAVGERASPDEALEVRRDVAEILTRYEQTGAERAPLLPGAKDVVAYAHAHGLGLGIVSANGEGPIRTALERLGLAHGFASVVGRIVERPLKPAPDMHRVALAELDLSATATLGVGDSAHDARAATAAGMTPIGVLGGEGDESALFGAGALYVLSDLEVLPSLLSWWARAAAIEPSGRKAL